MSRLDAARRVADAVLYEGYLLYPYRASSCKNQVRWQFGVVGPIGAEAAGVGEAGSMYTECLVEAGAQPRIDVIVRFLQVQWRAVERLVPGPGGHFEPTEELRAGSARWIPWHEAIAREHEVADVSLAPGDPPTVVDVDVPGGSDVELVHDDGRVVGRLVRTRWPLAGRLALSADSVDTSDRLLSARVELENVAAWDPDADVPGVTPRDLAARASFVSAHLLLTAHDGRFVSIVDPPDWAADAARGCTSSRCWPVLMGESGDQSAELLLGSPIILPEHPAVAEESPGDLFDATEIDEILTLRIMTMTDEEKLAARGTDPRAAAIIDRSDDMPAEIFERLHGALRGYGGAAGFDDAEIPTYGDSAPWFDEAADATVVPETNSVVIDGTTVTKGTRVRLRPRRRADAHDMFLAGRPAVVARVDLDVDGVSHVAVLLEDDPASDLHDWYGRYYYFGAEELEPLPALRPTDVTS